MPNGFPAKAGHHHFTAEIMGAPFASKEQDARTRASAGFGHARSMEW